MRALYQLVIFLAAITLSKQEFDDLACRKKCYEEFDWHKIHYVCTDGKNYPTPCYYECEKQSQESMGKVHPAPIPCEGFEACKNNCTEEEKDFVDITDRKWCGTEKNTIISGATKCDVKCESVHKHNFEKEPKVVLCIHLTQG